MKWVFNRQGFAAVVAATGMLALVGCANTRYDRSAGEFTSDKMLIQRVKSALNDQPVYKYQDVKVQTYRGVVQLSGFVATPQQKQAATEIVRGLRGVDELYNNILIAELAPIQSSSIPGRTMRQGEAMGSPDRATEMNTGAITNTGPRVIIREENGQIENQSEVEDREQYQNRSLNQPPRGPKQGQLQNQPNQ
jgi:hypothetical protein